MLLNLADDKLNADASTKVVEPVLSYAIDHASQERSYAKGIQSIERLDTPDAGDEAQTEANHASTKTHSSDEISNADYAQVGAWANQALRNDPLNARALRILAQIAEHSSDDARTAALMRGAAQRSLQESLAIFWMMRESYLRKSFAEAIRYADILLRTRPQLGEHVFPMLGRIAEESTAKADLKQVLAKDPPWRASFFSALPRNVTDARTPLEVLLNLRDTSAPPTDAELKSYLEALVQRGFYELAYYSWLQFLPPEQLTKTGRIFNASFETTPSGLPFDWVYKKGTGVNVKFAQNSDQVGQHALLIEFGPGRVEFNSGLSELVLLPAGTYRLRGKYKPDLVSQRGLRWTIQMCGGKRARWRKHPNEWIWTFMEGH